MRTRERFDAAVTAQHPLRHRLCLFALGCGALKASLVEHPGQAATLVATTRDGTVLSVAISGPAWKWHQALDQMEKRYDEKSDAGLRRFLGLKHAA